MSTETNAPQVFISYSWKPIQNKQKVLRLAERLTLDGVHVIIDDWDLKEGHDKYTFMEQMVNNSNVKRVLLVCNKEYAEKANQKAGGVGVESLIVSDEIYNKVDQTKFVPLVFEYDQMGQPYVPTFVKSRIFIDLSNDDVYEDSYESLLRNIYDRPASSRPPMGVMPSYLKDDEVVFLPTANKVSAIKNALLNERKNSHQLIQDYLDSFVVALDEFNVDVNSLKKETFIETVNDNINKLAILRDDFLNFLEVYITNSPTIDQEMFHAFFEKLLQRYIVSDAFGSSENTFGYIQWDNFRFLYYELFLTFTAYMFEKQKYSELAYILYHPFILTNRYSDIVTMSFTDLRQYVPTLNDHKKRKYELRRVSVTADLVNQRATSKVKFDQLREADLNLYFISLLVKPEDIYGSYWFPELSCYGYYKSTILSKTISNRFFDKVKVLFGVETKEELVNKINFIKNNEREVTLRGHYEIPSISAWLKIEDIGKIK